MAGVLFVDTVYSCCTRRFQLLNLWIDEIPEVLFTIQCNNKHHPFVVLLIMLYKVVLTIESVDEILWRGHSNESYWAELSCGTVYYAVQCGSYFWVCGWNSKMFSSKWKLLSSTVAVVLSFILLYKVVLTFESVDEINVLIRMKAIEQYFCCGTVHFAVQGGSYLTWIFGWNLNFWPFKWKLLSSTFQWYS